MQQISVRSRKGKVRNFLSGQPLILDFAVVEASLLMYTYLDVIICFFTESHQEPSPLDHESVLCSIVVSKVRTACLWVVHQDLVGVAISVVSCG
jgi:hypothetical protein